MVRPKSRPSNISKTSRGDQANVNVSIHKRKRKMRALREIRHLRKITKLLIPKAPFCRLVREIIFDLFPNHGIYRVESSALEALQEATEAYIVQFFEDSVLLAYHAHRVTLMIRDMILMRRLRGRDDVINK